MDFSPDTNTEVSVSDSSAWIPNLALELTMRGVLFKNTLFACDRETVCKYFPIGHSEWLDAPNFSQPRNFMTVTVVGGKVLVAGGKTLNKLGTTFNGTYLYLIYH